MPSFTKSKSSLAHIRDVQDQLRQVSDRVTTTLTQPDKTSLDEIAPRELQKTLSSKAFELWDLTFDMALSEIRSYQAWLALPQADRELAPKPLFSKGDLFRCADMSKDATSVFIGVLKVQEEARHNLEGEELRRMLIEAFRKDEDRR